MKFHVSTITAMLLQLAFAPSAVTAFVVPTQQHGMVSRNGRPLRVAQMEPPTTMPKANGEQPQGWECDEEANCVQVDLCDEEVCRTSLDVRIHGKWYDLSGWRKAHPAGVHWIDYYDGRDATEVMDGFHTEKGRQMVQKLPASDEKVAKMLEATVAPDSNIQIAFRKLRDDLERDGWWERDMVFEYTQLGIWASLVLGAAATSHSFEPLSIVLLSLSFTAAGWLGHDYIHGVDDFCMRLRNFAAAAAGLLPTWWSDKHNKHHALSTSFC